MIKPTMVNITMNLHNLYVEEMDKLIGEGKLYHSRSEFIRLGFNQYLLKNIDKYMDLVIKRKKLKKKIMEEIKLKRKYVKGTFRSRSKDFIPFTNDYKKNALLNYIYEHQGISDFELKQVMGLKNVQQIRYDLDKIDKSEAPLHARMVRHRGVGAGYTIYYFMK